MDHSVSVPRSPRAGLPGVAARRVAHRRGFTLVEVMIAAAVLALFIGVVYSAFLQTNAFAARVRLQTAAKIVLERATNTANTVSWTKLSDSQVPPTRPLVLQPTGGNFVAYDLDNFAAVPHPPSYVYGQIPLYSDPANNQVITGILSRKVVEVYNPGTAATSGTPKTDQSPAAIGNSDGLVRVTFQLVLDPPAGSHTYFGRTFGTFATYTMRARD